MGKLGAKNNDLPIIMTPDEAAEYLQISRRTLQEAMRQGKLPGRKVMGQWRVHREALKAFFMQPEPTLLPDNDRPAPSSVPNPKPDSSPEQ